MEGELTVRLSPKDINAIADRVCEKMLPALRVPEPAASPEDLMTAKEVQAFLKIKPSAFYEWLKNKTIPEGVRIGPKERRWARGDILSLVKKREEPA
ncbi:helix-turn-helix transcriptional regulator [Fretibacterium fastidiosum]|uniref:Prophage CP4-57 regulatory protein (AlpA) n=1 Tax=Fretibacterium fastidiosum TaxID=651822 RepID=A0AB94IZ07_9BACT|nr:helix-turn-helix domain-containing protein [Fretibacterium fastidiosum]CBL28924.1 Prophage CP4-57 regulatory protein (AlpA) [Fretibacterium fastidiosum]